MFEVSISLSGEKFTLPTKEETLAERKRLVQLAKNHKNLGREIAVVQGLGFVGVVMAAVIADAQNDDGQSHYFTVGIQRPSVRSYWKIPIINSGRTPIESEDPEVPQIIQRTVLEKKTFVATWVEDFYELADIVVVDVQLDARKKGLGNADEADVDLQGFRNAIRTIGRYVNPNALILIETTVPPGTTNHVALPILEEEYEKRGLNLDKFPPLLGHSYERVMPGKNYVGSIRDYHRTFAAVNSQAENLTQRFLENVLNTREFPLKKLNAPTASEIAKVLENSYRATNIAFIYEWTLFAEDIGINLFEVIDSVKVRTGTHDNMMYPGIGVGGYCLTKDPCLANWASKSIFNRKQPLNFSIQAVDINDLMPLHTFALVKDVFEGEIRGKKIAILGASYLNDVGDTRNSPTETLYDALSKNNAKPAVHDPYLLEWTERPDIPFMTELDDVLKNADGVVFAVKHKHYLDLEPDFVLDRATRPPRIIDAFNILNDIKIRRYKEAGCEVRGVGKGHIQSL